MLDEWKWYRLWSDTTFCSIWCRMRRLILVYTVCWCLSVPIIRVITICVWPIAAFIVATSLFSTKLYWYFSYFFTKAYIVVLYRSASSKKKYPITPLKYTKTYLKNIMYYCIFNPCPAKPDIPCLCKQCRSRSVGFWISQLIWICTVCH